MHARELRQSPRVPVAQMMIALPDGNRLVRGNVSCSGVGFELPEQVRVRPGDRIALQIVVPDSPDPLVLGAVVTRVQPPKPLVRGRSFIGARFVDLDVLVENPLYRYVEERSLLARPPTSA